MTGWRKPSYSNPSGNCVEVRVWRAVGMRAPVLVQVRDSKKPADPALAFAPGVWAAFLATVKAGEASR